MNPTYPVPFESDATRVLDRLVLDAEAPRSAARTFAPRLAAAERRVTVLKNEFLSTLADADAEAFVNAKRAVENLTDAVAAIDESGGPDGLHANALRTDVVFNTLAAGFREKVAALDKILPQRRKALGARRAELSEAGVTGIGEIEGDVEVIRLRLLVEATEAARRDAEEKRTYSSRWRSCERDQYPFADLRGALSAPLPV